MTMNEDNSGDGSAHRSSAEAPWSVDEALAKLPGGAPVAGSSSPVQFFHILERLKAMKRQGWLRHGVPPDEAESIAGHMYRMSLMTMLAPTSLSSQIDIPRCTKMALFHDLAEALVGDITPMDKVPTEEKLRRENTTMEYFANGLLGNVNGGTTGKEILDIWREFEAGETLDSKFVNDLDKIDLLLQMVEYERVHKLDLGEFSWTVKRIKLDAMKAWAAEILKERQDFWGERPHKSAEMLSEDSVAEKEDYYGQPKIRVL